MPQRAIAEHKIGMAVLPDHLNSKRFIMVAPNGGRNTKADHPAVPISVAEIVTCAQACWGAGANALHAHVRDDRGLHVLDAGLYRELLMECARVTPDLQMQITTEALGLYSAEQQRQLVRDVIPTHVSIALREQDPDADPDTARRFYHWAAEAGVEVQHILYAPKDRKWLEHLQDSGIVPHTPQRVLFVLGRYSDGLPSNSGSIQPFLDAGTRDVRWMVCAFGQTETDCLISAYQLGGEMRVGFENNTLNGDGSMAENNAERVLQLIRAI